MPSVKPGESRKAYLSRAIPYLIREGTAKNPAQAAAIAHSLFDRRKRKGSVKMSLPRLLNALDGSHALALSHDVSNEPRDKDGKWTDGGNTAKPAKLPKTPQPKKTVEQMSAAEINKLLDKLDAADSILTDMMIDAGRGHEKFSDWHEKQDPLSAEKRKSDELRSKLRTEIELRYGGRVHRLPKGFGPRKSEYYHDYNLKNA